MCLDNLFCEVRPIPGYPDYFVCEIGNVYSNKPGFWKLPRKKVPRMLKQATSYDGYRRVALSNKSRERINLSVHRLVLLTFIGPAPEGQVARHLNGDPADNRIENLSWGTHKENESDKRSHGTWLLGEHAPSSKLTHEQVRLIRTSTMSSHKLAKLLNIHQTTIARVRRRETWKHIA